MRLRTRAIFLGLAVLVAGALAYRWLDRPDPKCRPRTAVARPLPYALERVFGELTFPKPVQLLPYPGEPDTWLVVQHTGVVEKIRGNQRQTYFDLSDRVKIGQQWGLQEIALHPNFPKDPRIFVAYIAVDEGWLSVVSQLRASADGTTVDVGSEEILMSEPQRHEWHPLAGLKFGPDGYLYIAWGEGGGKSESPMLFGGKMLRIDVDRRDNGKLYAIPPDNPFLNTSYRPEVFAIGLRNPWRFTFDRETGEIWLGDVGDRSFEEVDRIVAGGHYGWPGWEGTSCLRTEFCSDPRVIPPVVQHSHSEMCSVTGGYVYRGSALPELRGRYVYADLCSATVWALHKDESGAMVTEPIARAPRQVASFAEAPDGELYVIEAHDSHEDYKEVETGFMAHRLVRGAPPSVAAASDETLSQAFCVADGDYAEEPEGMRRYSINMPAYAEGAEVIRFMTDVKGDAIYGAQDVIERPRKSVVMKTFAIDGRPVETQVLVVLLGYEWVARDYEWNDAGDDAQLLDRGKTKTLPNGQQWTFPGPEGCARCHNSQVGTLRALRLSQLAGTFDGSDQIRSLVKAGVLAWKEGESAVVPNPYARLDDEDAPLEKRARAYLDVNCSSCHQPGGNAGEASMDLRRATPFAAARLCGRAPNASFPGHEDASLLEPGKPESSLISIRMKLTDAAAMPPQRHTVDTAGARVVDAWIASLAECPQS